MTTNSEQAQPGSEQQPPQGTDQSQQQQPPATDQATEPAVVDIDQADIDAAKSEVEAEKASGGQVDTGQGQQPGDGQAQQQDQTPPAAQQQPPAVETVSIPKPRFDEALTRAQKAEQEAAYWKGMAEGRAPQPQPQGGQQQQQPAQPTPEQRLAEVKSQKQALAKKFDDGELTAADWESQREALEEKAQAIREEQLTAKLKPQQQAPAPDQNNDAYLAERTAELETPMVQAFDQVATEIDWKYVKDVAIENLVARGIDPTKGTAGTLALRGEISAVIERVGAGMVGDRLRAKGIAIPGQQAPAQQQGQQGTPPLSPTAQARQAKLNLAANAPPNLARMAGTTQDDGTPTDARIEQMSDDEIGNMPDTQRRRLLGLTG